MLVRLDESKGDEESAKRWKGCQLQKSLRRWTLQATQSQVLSATSSFLASRDTLTPEGSYKDAKSSARWWQISRTSFAFISFGWPGFQLALISRINIRQSDETNTLRSGNLWKGCYTRGCFVLSLTYESAIRVLSTPVKALMKWGTTRTTLFAFSYFDWWAGIKRISKRRIFFLSNLFISKSSVACPYLFDLCDFCQCLHTSNSESGILRYMILKRTCSDNAGDSSAPVPAAKGFMMSWFWYFRIKETNHKHQETQLKYL